MSGQPAAPSDPIGPAAGTHYAILARLDPAARTIAGNQILTWRNETATPAATLQLHLYNNAWRNTQSTWMRGRQLAGHTAPATRPEADWARIDITSLRVMRGPGDAEAIDLSRRLRFIAPGNGNTEDLTLAEVPLDRPIEPGERVHVAILWSSRVPRPFAGTGVIGNVYFLAHWFPALGVLRDDGWDARPFEAGTPPALGRASYDVHLEVPAGWVVGATGAGHGRREGPGGTIVHTYRQDHVHDFAWTASPEYLDLTDTFTHPTLPPVTLRLLLQPEHRGQEVRLFDAARAALQHFGEWFGPYPYDRLTIVDPAWRSGTGGRAYPTLVTTPTRWLAPRGALEPEGAAIRTIADQFWPGLAVAPDGEHAWLRDGLVSYAAARVLAERAGPRYTVRRYFGGFLPWVFHDLPLPPEADARAGAAAWPHTLERMLGRDTLQQVLATYVERHAAGPPDPDDLLAVVAEVSGQDLTWFVDQLAREAVFEYGIERFRSEPVVLRGYGAGPPPAFTDTVLPDTYRTTVVARRHGDGIFPVSVRVRFEGGEEVRWPWDGRARQAVFEIERPVRAVRADVDPDRVLLLDARDTNNSAVLGAAGRRAARTWSLVWLIWLQDRLLTHGLFV